MGTIDYILSTWYPWKVQFFQGYSHMWRIYFISLLFLLIFPKISIANPTPTIAQDVSVCNPYNPNYCMQPTSTGTMPVTGTVTTVPGVLQYQPTGHCQLSVTTAVQTSTCSGGIPATTDYALICNESTTARWLDDGTTPTTSIGMMLGQLVGRCIGYSGTLSTLQWVSAPQAGESGPSIIDFNFYK